MKSRILKIMVITIGIILLANLTSKATTPTISSNEVDIKKAQSESLGETSGEETEWTDFSKAQISLKKENMSNAKIEVTGVTPKEGRGYYVVITNNSDKPIITDIIEQGIEIYYDDTSKSLKNTLNDKLDKCVELSGDLYVSLVESKAPNINIALYGKKIDRFDEPKYTEAFFATFMSFDNDQIILNFTHNKENNRKLQMKVGKITDTNILQQIKNEDSSAFENLMKYAKSNSGIYDKTVDAVKNDAFGIKYDTSSNCPLIDLKGIEDGAYYYLYVKTDDENGKYVSNEGVTLAKANANYGYNWVMNFYGKDDFKWSEFGGSNQGGEKSDDTTIAPSKSLPYAGWTRYIVFGIAALSAIAVVSYKKYEKYKKI